MALRGLLVVLRSATRSSSKHEGEFEHTELSIRSRLLLGLLDDVGLVLVLLQTGISLADDALRLLIEASASAMGAGLR